jgi:hypothetical protein
MQRPDGHCATGEPTSRHKPLVVLGSIPGWGTATNNGRSTKEAIMPVVKTMQVQARDDYRKGLRVGDRAVFARTAGVIKNVRDGRDNAIITLTTDDGRTVERKWELMEPITIEREVPTPEEEFNSKVARVVEEGSKYQRQSHAVVYRLFTKLATTFAERDEKGYLYPFDIDEAMALEVAQRRDAMWRRVWALVEDGTDNGKAEGVAWCRAIAAVREDAVRALTAPYSNALSRSSSVTSNLVADIDKDVMREFLDVTKYMSVEGLLNEMEEK